MNLTLTGDMVLKKSSDIVKSNNFSRLQPFVKASTVGCILWHHSFLLLWAWFTGFHIFHSKFLEKRQIKKKKTDATGNVNEKAGGVKRGFPLCVPLDLTLRAYLLCSVADLLMSGIITLSAEAVCFGFCHRFIITLIAKHSARKQSSLPLV